MSQSAAPIKEKLSLVIDSLGGAGFNRAMLAYLSGLFGNLKGLALCYHKSARPEMLVNQVLDERVQEIYLSGLYVLDPLNNVTRANFSAGVYSFNKSFEIDSDKIRYQEEVFYQARISDELAWLIMMPDTSMLAYCLDRPDAQFSAEEIQMAKSELPVVKALVGKHFTLEFLRKLKEQPGAFTQIERILHLDSERLVESSRWHAELITLSDDDKARIEQEALAVRRSLGYRETILESEAVLTTCLVALEGGRYLQQRIRPTNSISVEHYKVIIHRALVQYSISDRERDVVFLSLLGYPNSLIAKKLSISSGTVKNHKYSIYNKLDITSERELFNLVLKNIVGVEF
ncbi:response regulator transcription factor [Halomonas sp. MCCC 1A11036]|uniref:Response regulator transcription factor n=1 Tax=Billgrantia zhangzhouensis TaxID=2733481 RepID=A0ABS9AHV4_9GAMM|nr:LuxR C-terminal-related transcriptional regulator [Halomonas zhangzhouensis]MCE8021335.1 response regulator transcription factor [Halomonas zhangzhouensis]